MIVLAIFLVRFLQAVVGQKDASGVGGTGCVVVRTGGGVVALSGSPQ